MAAAVDIELALAADLAGEADATRAHDATLGVVHDGRAEAHALGLVHGFGLLALELTLRDDPLMQPDEFRLLAGSGHQDVTQRYALG